MGTKSSIYLSDDIKAKLRVPPRGQSAAVSATIDRYDALLEPEKRRLYSLFNEDEWNAMRNACNGTCWEPAGTIRGGVLANIQDSLDDEIEAFGAKREELEMKLARLSTAQQYALVELIEAWWEIHSPAKNQKSGNKGA